MRHPRLDLAAARRMIAAAETRAGETGVRATIAILDGGGDLLAMIRMDGAWPGGFDLALGKATTARSFHAPSSAFVPLIQPGQPLFSVSNVGGGRYVILGGGFPVELDGNVIGAIGVSGGSVEQDIAIAEAALAAFNLSK
ncbi:heme-binding protein [Rhizobium sp. 1399]|uniref:GlcG/HbpS family heme-binding protein n=1 Tax=Rhizobium sp. 1399 TaxID=2817758 RepID=UPI00285C0700|nr:heme-binding protein [Rhizobium sp. 1399]MDR6670073.1 uncharacterized protein GlcG (DUF336 family) [Rhizobium sp. 1399]